MSGRNAYVLVLIACITVSIAGIGLAAFLHSPSDGGRGGALAVVASFAALFLGRDFGAIPITVLALRQEILKLRRAAVPAHAEDTGDPLDRLEGDLDALVSALKAANVHGASSTREQNWFLAISSILGTLAWGFGDWAAAWLDALAARS